MAKETSSARAQDHPVATPPEVFYTGETYAYRAAGGEVVVLNTKDEAEARQLAGLD